MPPRIRHRPAGVRVAVLASLVLLCARSAGAAMMDLEQYVPIRSGLKTWYFSDHQAATQTPGTGDPPAMVCMADGVQRGAQYWFRFVWGGPGYGTPCDQRQTDYDVLYWDTYPSKCGSRSESGARLYYQYTGSGNCRNAGPPARSGNGPCDHGIAYNPPVAYTWQCVDPAQPTYRSPPYPVTACIPSGPGCWRSSPKVLNNTTCRLAGTVQFIRYQAAPDDPEPLSIGDYDPTRPIAHIRVITVLHAASPDRSCAAPFTVRGQAHPLYDDWWFGTVHGVKTRIAAKGGFDLWVDDPGHYSLQVQSTNLK